MATECNICCEKFNKSTHGAIACEHSGACDFIACKLCIKTYLHSNSTDPNCMHCKKAWSDKFLAIKLGTTYMKEEYKTHRRELLLQQQISRLPEAMPAAEEYKKFLAQKAQMEKVKQELATIKTSKNNTKENTQNEIRRLLAAIKMLQPDITMIYDPAFRGPIFKKKQPPEQKFIMPCGNTDCRGFLSNQYKCGLCEHLTCAKCFSLIGLSKSESDHECKQENIESADFIRAESKPCPGCGTRISKISGCDQMWCTQCHKAFSWKTGRIEEGLIHNPHFYQYQQTQAGAQRGAPRNPGDVYCGGLPDYRRFTDFLHQKLLITHTKETTNALKALKVLLSDIHRLQVDFSANTLGLIRTALQTEQNFEREQVQYIVQEITKEELANKIFQKDKKRKINMALLHVCELFIAVGTDMFQQLMLLRMVDASAFCSAIQEQVTQYEQLRQYCNTQFAEISSLYGQCVPVIRADWSAQRTKYNAKGVEIKKPLAKNRDDDAAAFIAAGFALPSCISADKT